MCESGRCRVSVNGEADPMPLAWDHGPPWELRVDIAPLNGAEGLTGFTP
jgi:hypothetical protein